MARTDVGTIILYGGGIVLTYYILKSWGVISSPCDPSVCTPQCPKGPEYSRGYFESCDPGYLDCGILTPKCCCIAASSSVQSNLSNIENWKPLSEDEISQLKIEEISSPRDIYKDDTFEARTGRGRMNKYNFVSD